MSDEKKLGDLAFTAEDFHRIVQLIEEQTAGDDTADPSYSAQDVANIANNLLRERLQPLLSELNRLQDLCRMQEQHGTDFANSVAEELEQLRKLKAEVANAPVVYGFNTGSERWLWDTDSGKKDTHTARLVCVQKIREEK